MFTVAEIWNQMRCILIDEMLMILWYKITHTMKHNSVIKKICKGPAVWHSILSCCLQYQHPIWVPVNLLLTPFPIQRPVNVLGKAADDIPKSLNPLDERGSSWWSSSLWSGLSAMIEAIWRVNNKMENSLSLSNCLANKIKIDL